MDDQVTKILALTGFLSLDYLEADRDQVTKILAVPEFLSLDHPAGSRDEHFFPDLPPASIVGLDLSDFLNNVALSPEALDQSADVGLAAAKL